MIDMMEEETRVIGSVTRVLYIYTKHNCLVAKC